MISKLVLVLGPESTGTRWLSSVFSGHPDVEGPTGKHSDTLDDYWLSGQEADFLAAADVENEILVSRRSIPAGLAPGKKAEFTIFQDFNGLAELCLKHNVTLQVLVTTRSAYPHIESWTKNRASVEKSMVNSYIQYQMVYRYLFNWINEYSLSFFVVSLESAIYEESKFIKSLWCFLGLSPYDGEFTGDPSVNIKHYKEMEGHLVKPLSYDISKDIRQCEKDNEITVRFFFKEKEFQQVFETPYCLNIIVQPLKSQTFHLDIQGVKVSNIVALTTEPFKFTVQPVSLARKGQLFVSLTCSEGSVTESEFYVELVESKKKLAQGNSSPQIKELFSKFFSLNYMVDKVTVANFNNLMSDSHRFNISSALLNGVENIKYVHHLLTYDEIVESFNCHQSDSFLTELVEVVFNRSLSLLERELERDFDSAPFSWTVYKEQVLLIFSECKKILYDALVARCFSLILKRKLDEQFYKLIEVFLVYNVSFQITSDKNHLYSQVINAETRRDVLDFFKEKVLFESTIFSSLRGSLEGYSMAEIKSYNNELKSQIERTLDRSIAQVESSHASEMKSINEQISKFEHLYDEKFTTLTSEFNKYGSLLQESIEELNNKKSVENNSVRKELANALKEFESIRNSFDDSLRGLSRFEEIEREKLREEFEQTTANDKREWGKLKVSLARRFEEIALLTRELSKSKDIIKTLEMSYSAEIQTLKDGLSSIKSESTELRQSLELSNEKLESYELSLQSRYEEIAALTERCEYLEKQSNKITHAYTNSMNDNLNVRKVNDIVILYAKNKKDSLSYAELFKLGVVRIKLSKKDFSDYNCILRSGLFDKNYYLSMYEDVSNSKLYKKDPLLHYVQFGWKEARDPNECFSSQAYLEKNKDIALSAANPLAHFIRTGIFESRDL